MVHHLLEEIRHDGVDYVEEVVTARTLSSSKIIGKVLGNLRIFGHLRPQCFDRQLLVVRDLDVHDVLLFKELLLLAQDLLEEVLVDP